MTAAANGNVGIGTASPINLLHVASASNTFVTVDSGATGRAAQVMFLRGNANPSYVGPSAQGPFTITTSESIPITFNNSGFTERMRVAANGFIGIGTSSPQTNLDVAGYISSTSGISANQVQLGVGTADVSMSYAYESVGVRGSANNLRLQSPNSIMFHTKGSSDTVPMSKMVLTDTGRLGVGTNTPMNTLDVNGNIRAFNASGNASVSFAYTGSSGRTYSLISCLACASTGLGGLVVYDNTATADRAFIAAGVNGWQTPSDRRLKTNIQTLSVLDKIDTMRGVSFILKDSGKPQIGVIAQEMRQAFPAAVTGKETSSTYLGVSYDAVAAISLQGVKELKGDNDNLRAELDQLRQEFEAYKKQHAAGK